MKLTTFVSTLALGAVLTVPAMQASGISLASGEVEIGFYGGGQTYDAATLAPLPRGPLFDPAASPTIGSRDFTALRANDLFINGEAFGIQPSNGIEITGIVTFLDVAGFTDITVTNPNPPFNSFTQSGLMLENASRNPNSVGSDGIGRFFLFNATADPGAADFATYGPDGIEHVEWSDGTAATQVSDGVGTWDIDHLTSFSRDADGNQYPLLMTGYIVPIDFDALPNTTVDGPDSGLFLPLSASGFGGVAFTGQTAVYQLVVDGGTWFQHGDITNSEFDFGYLGLDGTQQAGRSDVWDGGWQLQLDDPVAFDFSAIPEPISASLAGLGLLAAAGAATRRRRN